MVQVQLSPPKSIVISDFIEVIKDTKGKTTKMASLGQRFKEVLDKRGVQPQALGFSKNHLTRSLLQWLEKNQIVTYQASANTDSVVVRLNGVPKIISSGKDNQPGKKKDFSIQRPGRSSYERTVVGRDGQKHVMESDKKGKEGHFTDEGKYRRAIEQAVRENSR